MTSLVERWVPQLTNKLNIGYDLLAIFGVAFVLSQDPWSAVFAEFLVLSVMLWGAASFVLRYYDPWANRLATDETALLSLLVLSVGAMVGVFDLLSAGPTGLPHIAYFLLLLWPAVLFPRLLVFRRLELKNLPRDEVLIVGTGPRARFTAEDLERSPRAPRKVAGFLRFPDEPAVNAINGVAVLGNSDELEQCLRTTPVSEVYLAGNALQNGPAMQQSIRICERFGVPFALPAWNFRLGRARPVNESAILDGYLHYTSYEGKTWQRAVKRLFDIAVSMVALVLLSPLLLVVAALIKLTSKGPVFFRQERVGLYGRPFNMLKFRSMVVNAEALKEKLQAHNEQTGPVFKIRNDPRITPIGRFIRKYSIDELPQLINVLRGDMSLVGPRPPVPKEVVQYEGWQRRRLSVRPGLTCIWQVSGRNQISFEEWMYLDMRYIDHWSLSEDITLILKTVPVVLTGRGAS
ncbi:MAG: sugar transferase [Myxococcaceae bacterium]